jgi:hypothetical protein
VFIFFWIRDGGKVRILPGLHRKVTVRFGFLLQVEVRLSDYATTTVRRKMATQALLGGKAAP